MKRKFLLLTYTIMLMVLGVQSTYSQDTKPPVLLTTYSATILVGKEFTHQVVVKSLMAVMPNSYKLASKPDGMTIDEKTGLIKWTPTVKGEFSVEASAYLTSSSGTSTMLGSEYIKLKVVDVLGSVTGTIKASDNAALPYANVTLYKKVSVSGKDSYVSSYSGSTDATGLYKIANVEVGTYFAYAMAKSTDPTIMYQAVYYPNAATIDAATPLVVSNATPVAANFILQKTVIPTTEFVDYSASIKIGTEFKYQVNVKLPEGTTSALYRLTARPEGMIINESSGAITWTPKVKGDFSAQVTVTVKDLKIALVNMKLNVFSLAGSISGTVIDQDKNPLANIIVMLYKKISSTEKPMGYVGSSSAVTNKDGKYTVTNVDEGSYYVYARQNNEKSMTPVATIYLPMYYDNALTIDKAKEVPVSAAVSAVNNINFILQKYIKTEPVKANLSGTVTDASGKAIAGAKILVTETKPVTTSNSVADGINFLVLQNASVSCFADILGDVKTDANGKYTIALIAGTSYVVSCSADGYVPQFYNGKTSILDANKISLKRDTTGIDFKLSAVPVAKAVVSGIVKDKDNLPVVSKVILYSLNAATSIIEKSILSVATSVTGEFKFEKVPNGKYYLQAIPLKDYLPAYYKLNECGVREPKLADIITVANDVNVANLAVCVTKVKLTGGGKISGLITDYFGAPVSGVVVIAESVNGGDLSFDISDTDGSYEIDNLGVDTYSVYSDKAGFANSFANNAVIDYQNKQFSTQVNLIINAPVVTDVKNVNTIPTQFELMQNYPNPFNPSTIISWQIIESSHVTLKVFDMLGREVATLVDELKQPGVYNVQFSIQNLPAGRQGSQLSSGIYFYTLQAGNLIQTKKMLLMK